MSLTSDELQRLSEDIYTDRRITMSTYCGRCGHNLRTLPYVYSCPECGNSYNARPLKLEGIFTPEQVRFPFGNIFGTLITAAGAFLFVATAFGYQTPLLPPPPVAPPGKLPAPPTSPALDSVGFTIGVALALLAVLYAWLTFRQLCVFWRGLWIARKVARDEAEEG